CLVIDRGELVRRRALRSALLEGASLHELALDAEERRVPAGGGTLARLLVLDAEQLAQEAREVARDLDQQVSFRRAGERGTPVLLETPGSLRVGLLQVPVARRRQVGEPEGVVQVGIREVSDPKPRQTGLVAQVDGWFGHWLNV